jgi:hypothetical protein
MSKKRRKRSGYRPPAAAQPQVRRSDAAAEPPAVPRFLGWLAKPAAGSPWPTIPRALARGFVTVGSSPPLLLTGFVLLLLMWVGLVALGLEGPAGRLVNMLALPPVSTYSDALNGVTIYGLGPQGLIAASVFLLFRSVVLALLTGMTVALLEGDGSVVRGLFAGLRAIPVAIAVNLLTLSLMITSSLVLPLLGAGLGFLGSVLTLVAALFLFVFAPVIAVREPGRPFPDAIRRGARAAMMPGSRHLLMCLGYIFLTLPILVMAAPGGALLGVNPTLAMWAYALVCTFVHLSFLAAFAYRLMAVEDEIPEPQARSRRR